MGRRQREQTKGNGLISEPPASGLQDEPPSSEPLAPCYTCQAHRALLCLPGQSPGRCRSVSWCIRAPPAPAWSWMPSGPKVAGTLLVLSPDTEDREVGGGSTHNLTLSFPFALDPARHVGLYVCMYLCVPVCWCSCLCVTFSVSFQVLGCLCQITCRRSN